MNFTSDQAIALDSQFWVITTVKPTTMYITCLTEIFYIELQHPLDIIFLEESCDASTPSMLLPSHTTLSREVSQTKLGFQLEQLRLNYTDIKDFTAIKDISLETLSSTLLQIDSKYHWQMPTWLKFFLSIITTVIVIGIIVICCICRARGIYVEECLLHLCSKKSKTKSFVKKLLNTKSFSTMKNSQPMHITHPHLLEMIPLNEIKHHPGPSTSLKAMERSPLRQYGNKSSLPKIKENIQNSQKTMVRAKPEMVAAAMSELADIDFEKFYKKKANHLHKTPAFMEE